VAGYFVAVILGAAVVAALVAVLSSGGGDSTSAAAEGAFGTHFSGLEERRVAAGVPTMSDTSAGGEHIHPRLAVYVRGEQVPLPANIGVDPAQPPQSMAGLHTHEGDGLIHVENAAEPTLGQFFEIWGVPFSATELGPYKAGESEQVRMWADGTPSAEFGDLVMEDGQQIVISFGPSDAPPPPLDVEA
jgi:hypothetical protein